MAQIEKHAPGSFCWIELATTDQNAAKQFYTSLFGWSVNEFPMGPGETYTIFKLEGKDAAAAYALRPEMQSQGVPPHWMIYIASESADGTAERASQLGGQVTAAPFDVYDLGRMSVIQDPTGVTFSVWEATGHTGTGVAGVPGTLCWADLNTPEPDRAAKFYSDLFGWKYDPGKDDPSYLHIMKGDEYIGGIPGGASRDPNVPPHWLAYFAVSDCDGIAAKAEAQGARFPLRPMTMENVGRLAVISDPQGAVFALYQAMPHE